MILTDEQRIQGIIQLGKDREELEKERTPAEIYIIDTKPALA
jgi:hypothetical protein